MQQQINTTMKPLNQNKMKTPEIILIALWSIGLLFIAYKHGEPKESKYNIFVSIVALSIHIALLMWAGLFNL